jgi:hypothetical protein
MHHSNAGSLHGRYVNEEVYLLPTIPEAANKQPTDGSRKEAKIYK